MFTNDFDYSLPEELIASKPLESRDASRMMVVDRSSGTVEHHNFRDFPTRLESGDLVVLNNTQVVRARFYSDDEKVELLRLEELSPVRWKCMVRPGKRMRLGKTVVIGGVTGTVVEILEEGERIVEFAEPVSEETHGQLALPHYMGREGDAVDTERYQTVYADAGQRGAIAAPTAGLHFTPDILEPLNHAFVTLHVGVGTFQPVRADRITDHVMHSERYVISPETVGKIEKAENVVAIGTTVARVLEHAARDPRGIQPHDGETDIFIYPGFEFRALGGLLTNFHLPKSTLFMLVCAYAGTELMKEAYAEAVKERYRFFSYGDCMLIR